MSETKWRSYFDSRSTPEPNTGCYLWTLCVDGGGYGVARILGENKAHRISWRLMFGAIPAGMKVLHRCDVRCCVNPAHLFIGTQADNVADMVSKGRNRSVPRFGTANPMAVLNEEDVWSIREMLRLRLFSQAEIATDYGVSPMTLSRIATGQTWKHVTPAWPFDEATHV